MGKAKIGNAIEEKNRAIEKAVRAMLDKPKDVTDRERAEEIQQQAAEIRARARPEGRYTISEAMIMLLAETGVFYNIEQAVRKDEIPGFTDESGNRMQNPVGWVCWDDLNKWMEKNTHIRFRFPNPNTHATRVDARAALRTNDNEPDDEELHRGLDGAPSLKKGKNNRDKVDAWVKWQANKMVKPNDTLPDLIGRIRLEANKWGYESERKPLTDEIIRKMLPSKITGGREKNRGKSKK